MSAAAGFSPSEAKIFLRQYRSIAGGRRPFRGPSASLAIAKVYRRASRSATEQRIGAADDERGCSCATAVKTASKPRSALASRTWSLSPRVRAVALHFLRNRFRKRLVGLRSKPMMVAACASGFRAHVVERPSITASGPTADESAASRARPLLSR